MTIKPILRTTYKSKDGYPIVIRIINGKQQKLHYTGYKVQENQWKNGQVKSHKDAAIINHAIDKLISKAKKYLAECKELGRKPEMEKLFTTERALTFNDYLKKKAAFYLESGNREWSMRITRLELELSESIGQLYFDETDISKYLICIKDLHPNTKAKKVGYLRQYYTKAMKEGLSKFNPFEIKLKRVPTKKEKLTKEELQALENVVLSGNPKLSRDLFLFSYYAKGVRFENCVTLRRSQIVDGRIFFKTNKGKAFLSVLIHPKLQAILDQYDGKDFVFPYLKKMPDPESYHRRLGTINNMANRDLKLAAAYAGIQTHLTMHIARHTLAYNLKKADTDIGAISDILGHSSARITQAYLKSLDDERLDGEMDKVYG